MAKKKEDIIPKGKLITEQTVVGISKAEALQKSGWQLISAVQVEKDEQGMTIKEYKFKKE